MLPDWTLPLLCTVLGWAALVFAARWWALDRWARSHCIGCGGRVAAGELAAFVPCVGDEVRPAVRAGMWCHHRCLSAHCLEAAWTIDDVRSAGFTVKPGPLDRIDLPRAVLP